MADLNVKTEDEEQVLSAAASAVRALAKELVRLRCEIEAHAERLDKLEAKPNSIAVVERDALVDAKAEADVRPVTEAKPAADVRPLADAKAVADLQPADDAKPVADFSLVPPVADAELEHCRSRVAGVRRRIRKKTMFPLAQVSTLAKSPSLASATSTCIAEEKEAGARVRVSVAARQSGVRGVSWQERRKHWVSTFMQDGKQRNVLFPVAMYRAPGSTEEEAIQAACEAAIKHRQEKVKSGEVRVVNKHNRYSERSSGVKGVQWHTKKKSWYAYIYVRGQKITLPSVRPANLSAEEIERTRQIAVARRLELERRHFDVRVGRPSSGAEKAVQKAKSAET
eukprot:TRINITY_DN1874_c1_g1_i1.p1 TRINITY_DN1874_c1_g1~~TRINITY_DN1874_c1_g1_i1.p1  ORF type:complete len:384 (-),score=74.12 TRINITY_DN1874_c1_g1_i1:79-1098(-)